MLVSYVVDIGSESAGLISRTEHINLISTMNVNGKLSLSPQIPFHNKKIASLWW